MGLYLIGGRKQWRCFAFKGAKPARKHSPSFIAGSVMPRREFERFALPFDPRVTAAPVAAGQAAPPDYYGAAVHPFLKQRSPAAAPVDPYVPAVSYDAPPEYYVPTARSEPSPTPTYLPVEQYNAPAVAAPRRAAPRRAS
jgi:hypothetical protein